MSSTLTKKRSSSPFSEASLTKKRRDEDLKKKDLEDLKKDLKEGLEDFRKNLQDLKKGLQKRDLEKKKLQKSDLKEKEEPEENSEEDEKGLKGLEARVRKAREQALKEELERHPGSSPTFFYSEREAIKKQKEVQRHLEGVNEGAYHLNRLFNAFDNPKHLKGYLGGGNAYRFLQKAHFALNGDEDSSSNMDQDLSAFDFSRLAPFVTEFYEDSSGDESSGDEDENDD